MNLGYLIDNAVMRYRDHIATFDRGRSFTFAATDARINRLGNRLLSLGIAPKSRIASLQYNGIEALEFDLMACRFGFVRTLLNARSSAEDHIRQLNAIGASFLIFSSDFAEHAAAIRSGVPNLQTMVCVGGSTPFADEYEESLAQSDPAPPVIDVAEADGHSIYFTSGSTGTPKAVLLSQRTWLAVVRNHLMETYASSGTNDVLLHAAPMSHASGSLILAHLVRGARQTFLKRFEPAPVLDSFQRDSVTTTWLAPTMLIMLFEAGRQGRTYPNLRSVRFGGGPMPAPRIKEAVERWGPVFCSGWGQWEAPQQSTFFSQSQIAQAAASGPAERLASVGLPMAFTLLAVASDDDRILSPGAEGEIVVAGDHLMVEYLGDPVATGALRFGPWQRTGDMGRVDVDGFVYLTGRRRELIVSGGSNVSPREVENVLHAHPDILEAIVLGRPDARWGETVHAVVVARLGSKLDAEGLLVWCREKLPSYKRVRSVEFVGELPKDAYGKIQRKKIAERLLSSISKT